ncbi:hypothetical protein C1645_824640 [Glomus cerebriforme]|uniref:Sel1 repeat domain-containing protein n=1 Tax=Glomus cerebriforme TaxID=658196 RepID=A0A397T3F6_9GLOM|nr:hypothetical protein C1645_824640 [Glomus cerebriforme]
MSDSLHIELSQIIQHFDILNLKEMEPTTKNINKNVFEEDLSIVIDELVNLYFKELNEGKLEKVRKQHVLDYFNNHMINLQEIYLWLLNNQNDPNSIYLFGYFNYYGIVTNINKQKALKLYHKAANLGNHTALFYLANMYMDGEGADVNYKKALEFSEELAGKKCSSGINLLAYCYHNGIGTDVNLPKSFELFQKSADLGNALGMNNLGCCYERGIGTVFNIQKAFELYQKAASLGNYFSQYNLALIYEYGNVPIKKDINKAIYWYKKAAEQGYESAQNKLNGLN